MDKKILSSVAALAAALLIALASPIASAHADATPTPGGIQPLSNGDGGGP